MMIDIARKIICLVFDTLRNCTFITHIVNITSMEINITQDPKEIDWEVDEENTVVRDGINGRLRVSELTPEIC